RDVERIDLLTEGRSHVDRLAVGVAGQNARGAFRVVQSELEGAVARVPVGRLLGHCSVVGTKNGSCAVDDRSRRRRVHAILAERTASSAPGRDLAGLADAE